MNNQMIIKWNLKLAHQNILIDKQPQHQGKNQCWASTQHIKVSGTPM